MVRFMDSHYPFGIFKLFFQVPFSKLIFEMKKNSWGLFKKNNKYDLGEYVVS